MGCLKALPPEGSPNWARYAPHINFGTWAEVRFSSPFGLHGSPGQIDTQKRGCRRSRMPLAARARVALSLLQGPPTPEAPLTCARATPHVNVESWKKVRHLPPFGVPDWVNKAL